MRRQNQIFKVVGNFLFSSLNKEFLIFLFFLLLSGAFWLMMALNETYEEELKVPVRLVGMPRNAVMTDEPADTVKVTVRDKGFTLVTYKYGHWFRPLTFKFATYANEDQGHGAIPAADIIKQVQSQLYGSSKLLSVKPEKLDFYFTYGASKKVPIRFRGKISTSKSYYLAHTEFSPMMVTAYANKKVLDELKYVEIEPFNYRNLQDTIHQNVRLQKIRGVKLVPSTVRLSVYPDVLTEESIEVPVSAVNMPVGMVLRTFPSRVTVRFTIGASQFRMIRPEQFNVVVDYQALAENPSDKCTLQLRSVPSSVSKAKLELDKVDYLLEQQ
nr:YbbR-like domain-containing protein [uncultured Prevotella sp.]